KPSSAATSIRSAVSASTRAISRFSMCPVRKCSHQVWLDVHQNIRHPIHLLANPDADLGCNLVRFVDAHGRVDFQMQIHMPLQSGLARVAFLDSECTWNTEPHLPD